MDKLNLYFNKAKEIGKAAWEVNESFAVMVHHCRAIRQDILKIIDRFQNYDKRKDA